MAKKKIDPLCSEDGQMMPVDATEIDNDFISYVQNHDDCMTDTETLQDPIAVPENESEYPSNTSTEDTSGNNNYDTLLEELCENNSPLNNSETLASDSASDTESDNSTVTKEDVLLLNDESEENDSGQTDSSEDAHIIIRSPSYMSRRERILTIDAKGEVQTEEDREATIWHEIQNAYRNRRILAGTLDGIERTPSGMTLAVANYKGFRVAIPLKEMMLYTGRMPNGTAYANLMEQLSRALNARLGAEMDFIVKGIENKSRSIVASRKDAMLRKRQIFYLDTDEFGEHMIYEGRVVQARVISVAERFILVEVFGVECVIRPPRLSWEWIGNARDHFSVGDRILVRVVKIDRGNVNTVSIVADARSITFNNSLTNLRKCVPQSRYAGRVTDVRNGVIYVRLNNGVNAIAHSCYDHRYPGKKDDVSFAVTQIDEEMCVAVGIITRIIKQNL